MSDKTTHDLDYTFLEFIGDLLERVSQTKNLEQQMTIELPMGHKVSLRVEVIDAELDGEVSESVH